MEGTAAQSSFVEIAFGVNTFFAVYSNFREYLRQNVDKKVQEYEARTKTIEPKRDEVTRLNAVKNAVSRFAAQHLRIQHVCVRAATVASIAAAACSLAVVFWDLLDYLGHHTGWLILPLPAYFLVSVINYGIFRARGGWKLHRFKKFIDEFEPPPPIPPELKP
jgi:hypothetical protein